MDKYWISRVITALTVLLTPAALLAKGKKPLFTTEGWIFLAVLVAVPALLFIKKNRRLRYLILLLSLVFFGFLQWSCPRFPQTIQYAMMYFGDWDKILRNLIKLGVLLIPAFVFGKYYCGWICPKGAIQELLYREKYGIKVHPTVDRVLKYFKYVVLLALIVVPLVWQFPLMQHIGPFKVIFNLDGSTFLVIFLAIVLLTSIFIERPFCRYFCPIGALLGLINKIAPFKIRGSGINSCSACGMCDRACPTAALYSRNSKGLNKCGFQESECIVCLECTKSCRRTVLKYTARKPNVDGGPSVPT